MKHFITCNAGYLGNKAPEKKANKCPKKDEEIVAMVQNNQQWSDAFKDEKTEKEKPIVEDEILAMLGIREGGVKK